MTPPPPLTAVPAALEDEAAELFIRRLYGEWNMADQAACESRLAQDPAFALAFRRVEDSWRALDRHAESPQLITYRSEAIGIVRRANARGWLQHNPLHWLTQQWKVAAAIAGLAVLGVIWQVSPYGFRPGEYRTAIGEQRIVELADHTRITIDATTHLLVRFTKDIRSVQLLRGQAQFSVAKDPSRPFEVIAGGRTIVAVGTVFTVEYVDNRIQVAMVEGKVAVLASNQRDVKNVPPAAPEIEALPQSDAAQADVARPASQQADDAAVEEIYLSAGEQLDVGQDGSSVVTPKADIAAVTAWREGKVIFRTTPLGEAVRRMNRYSHLQLKIDDSALAAQKFSGVFEAGDTRGFVGALQRYLSVKADYSEPGTVRLSLN
jgi:transmembrane sensor